MFKRLPIRTIGFVLSSPRIEIPEGWVAITYIYRSGSPYDALICVLEKDRWKNYN